MSDTDNHLIFNGVNATTGKPLMPALTIDQIGRIARGEVWDPEHRAELESWNDFVHEKDMGPGQGIDHRRLEETGWGVIFPHDCAAEIRSALEPLLDLRREQAAGEHEHYYRELHHRPRESKSKFLARLGDSPGPANPDVMPYYLLIVGKPGAIPFSFQYQLDLQYAVGRIYFETAAEYARYAETVVAAEQGKLTRPRKATFFAVANPDDRATERSWHSLAQPLADKLESQWPDWAFERVAGDEATKAALGELLSSDDRPAAVFTTSHGVSFALGDPLQTRHQGALLCRDWPGPREWRSKIPEDHYFSADDVSEAASPAGLVAFHFACYGAGTPERDSFQHRDGRGQIAPESFVARLPQRLLAHPRGGALAIVGHVDRAWSYSFDWPRAGQQLEVFRSAFGRLFEGYPVGAAMDYFNDRYAELSADLNHEIENSKYEEEPDFMSLSSLWTAHNDARSYVVLGDPAVRLAVSER